MVQDHFQMYFYQPVGHEFQENEKSTNLSGKNVFYRMAEPAQQFSL